MEKIFLCTAFKLCDNNGYLTTQLSNFFKSNSVELVRDPEEADTIVITTCGFDQERENESTALVNQYLRQYRGEKKVIVSGCLTKINPEAFDSGVNLIGNKELHLFNERFGATTSIDDVSGGDLSDEFISSEYGFVDAYYIQICQGCVNNCSYCAIKKAKGHVASKPIEVILREVERGMKMGFTRFMLLGDDCGSYGADLGVNLAQLLNRLIPYDIRVLINYLEPGRFLSLYPRIDVAALEMIDFMNVPVQAVSRRIIRLMNRNYDAHWVMETARQLKEKFPALYLETHVIFGFPGETREEFRETLRLAEIFDAVIYFRYTDRKGVKSAELPGKVSEQEVELRIEEIVRHPRFAWKQQDAAPPLVLLGYGPETSELFQRLGLQDEGKAAVARDGAHAS
ncbi:radical SAM protein [Geomonas azotofigens]|uniref:radical SAM protein n=1 Tax=Geomonas azotofigens TaxID=2843196 RepID=UPI001C0F6ABB|nr:radical SAM protein [Geomonas azotofigens]MBU5613868.1 radical SAM protein [Geomonas azotofigens]